MMLKVSKKDISDTELLLSISIPQEEVCTLLHKELLSIRSNKSVPGFRKGKTPEHLAQKFWGEQAKISFINKLVPIFLQKSIEKENICFLGSPAITHMSEPSKKEDFFLECKVMLYPYAKISSLDTISLQKLQLDYNLQDFVNLEMKRILRNQATLMNLDLENALADEFQILTLDIVHHKEDSDSIDLSIKDFQLETSPWIKDPYNLKSHCLGIKCKETKKIQIEYPLDYQNPFLCGKQVKFSVTIKNIQSIEMPQGDIQSITGISQENWEKSCEIFCTERAHLILSKKKKKLLIQSLLPRSSFYISEKFWELSSQNSGGKISSQELQKSMLPHLKETLIMQFLSKTVSMESSNSIENYVEYMSSTSGDTYHEIKKNLMKNKDRDKIIESFREFELIDTLYEKFSKDSKNTELVTVAYLDIF